MKSIKPTTSFIIIVLSILTTPLFLTIIRVKVIPQNKLERPIKLNFKRNFPIREDIFKLHSYIKKKWLKNDVVPHLVIEGKDNWKFMGNHFSNSFSESKGLIIFSKKELKQIEKNLQENKKWAADRGTKLYISVSPNKLSIYGDKVDIPRGRTTKLEQLDSICKITGIPFINLGKYLDRKKHEKLYLQTDSHWNNLAGFYAYKATLEEISKEYQSISFCTLKDSDFVLNIYKWSRLGDLNNILYINKYEDFIDVNFKGKLNFETLNKQLDIPKNFRFRNSVYEERYKSEANNLKIVVLRDSFFGAYFHMIANSFGESVFVWDHTFNKDLISKENPEILLYEIVERDIDLLLENKL